MGQRTIRRCEGGVWYELKPAANGVWYIHWSESRRSKRASTRQTDLRLAQAFFDEWLRAAAQPAAALTVTDLYAMKYDMAGQSRAVWAWKRLEPHFGGRALSALAADDDQRYARARRADGAAPATIRFEMACLRAALARAVAKRLVASTDLPVWDALPPDSPPRDRWFTQEEVAAQLAAAEPLSPIWAWMHLALYTCARRTAIANLRWIQVDRGRGVIHYLPDGEEQTRKRRPSVPISDGLAPVLRRLYEHRRGELVCGRGGSPRWVNDELARVARAAGVEGSTPHVWRHTGATWMARDPKVGLFHVAKMLGITVEVAERTYAKHRPEDLRDAAGAISIVSAA